MSLTAGTISLVQKYADKLDLATTAATGGTSPYAYSWHVSKTSSFSPDASNKVAGASGLSATVTGLIPGQQYYFKVVVEDLGDSGVTATSAEFATSTEPQSYSQNQYAQTGALGAVDKLHSTNVLPAIAGETLVSGQAVAYGADGKVHAVAANTDRIDGFVVFNAKGNIYHDGSALEIARSGAYILLRATTDLTAGTPVALDPTCIGGVTSVVSTEDPVGQVIKNASTGELTTVFLACPAL